MDLLYFGVVAAALLSIIGLYRVTVRPAWRRVDGFLRDWNGDPTRPGFAGRPSMPERMAAVEHQLTPNGGETLNLADRVIRLERHAGTEPEETQ